MASWIAAAKIATDADADGRTDPRVLLSLYGAALTALCRDLQDSNPSDAAAAVYRDARDQYVRRARAIRAEIDGAPKAPTRRPARFGAPRPTAAANAAATAAFVFQDVAPDDAPFDAVVGNDAAKEQLLSATLWNESGERPRVVLLHGPPGTGKTMIAEAIAGLARRPFLKIQSAQLLDDRFGGSEKNVTALFDEAERVGGVVFLDEIDALCSARTSSDSDVTRRVKIALLTNIERPGVLVICNTNRLADLDEALKSRFSASIRVDLPREQDVAVMIERAWGRAPARSTVDAARGLSGRGVRRAVDSARGDLVRACMRRNAFHETLEGDFVPCDGADGCEPGDPSLSAPRPEMDRIRFPPTPEDALAATLARWPRNERE